MLQMIREIKDTLKIQETNDDLKIIEDYVLKVIETVEKANGAAVQGQQSQALTVQQSGARYARPALLELGLPFHIPLSCDGTGFMMPRVPN